MDQEYRSVMRVDVAVVQRGLAQSRERAQSLIASGLVRVNGKIIDKPSVKVAESDSIDILGSDCPYVSRGGLKLAHALEAFSVNVKDRVCVDVGASTGGFTDVLLKNGAKKVYAVDVGTDQLVDALKSDARVVSMEQTNARTLNRLMFDEPPTLAVMDVSFISVRLILPALLFVGEVVSLIKPQFECGPKALGKNGIVSDRKTHESVLKSLTADAPTLGWSIKALTVSPIKGTAGNIEFLGHFVPYDAQIAVPTGEQIAQLVKKAHTSK